MELHVSVVLGIHDQVKLDQLLADQQNLSSSHYNRWLTPSQFNQRFGPTQAQTDAVVRWLESQGLRVTSINRLGRTIEAVVNVTKAENAFATTIVTSGTNFANASDPAISAEFASVIVAIQGLDNLHAVVPVGLHRRLPAADESCRRRRSLRWPTLLIPEPTMAVRFPPPRPAEGRPPSVRSTSKIFTTRGR